MPARYQQLAARLRAAIETGEYQAGDTIPTQMDLAAEYGVTRATVSAAIRVLESAGLVRPIRRRGTVVLDQRPIRLHLSRYRQVLAPGGTRGPFETACAEIGVAGVMRTVEVETEDATDDVALGLRIPPGSRVVRRSRVALAGDVPVQLQTSWFPLDLVEGTVLAGQGKVVGGVYGALAQAGHPPAVADEQVTARQATENEKIELWLRGEPVFQIERVTSDDSGRPLELLQVIANSRRTVLVYDQLPLSR